MKPTRTAIYARVSTDEQKKFGYSIEAQLDKLNYYVTDNNLIVVDSYVDEGFSAGSTDRPELQRMLQDLNKFDLIIFTRLDRFTRNVLDANEMVQLFDRNNVGIKAIDEDDVDTSTADGMFMFNLKVSLAQRELKKGSERITTVFEYKVKQGQPISGAIPFGYKIHTNEHGIKSIVKDEEVSHIVDEIFEHFLTNQSVRQAALHINSKYNLDFVYQTYNRLLKRQLYTGIYRGNDNYCEPYISLDQYNRIQEIRKKNIRVRKNNYIYLFSGLIVCPKCGRNATGMFNKTKYSGHYYYRCNQKGMVRDCDMKFIREDILEDYLLKNINSMIDDYMCAATIELDNKPKPVIDIKEITDEIDRLNKQFRKGRIEEKDYDYEYELLEKKLAEAQKEIPEEADLSGLHDFINSGWQNVYRTLEKAEQRALFRSIIKNINIDAAGNISVDFL